MDKMWLPVYYKRMVSSGAREYPSHDVRRKTLDSLTSLRFFAALLVFVWHVRGMIGVPFIAALQLGYMGVGFFYVLSGFILTYVYSAKLERPTSELVKKFYISRIAKLFPVHILTFIVSIPLVLLSIQAVFPAHTTLHLLAAGIANLLLLQSWLPSNNYNFSFNGVAWSISVEMFFYALFPVLIFLAGKYRKVLSARGIIVAMITLWLVMMALYLPFGSVIDDWKFYIFPPARLPDFMIGILLGLLFLRAPHEDPNIRHVVKSIGSTRYEVFALILVVPAIVLSIWMPQSLRFAGWMMPFWAFIIFVFSQQGGAVSRFLSRRLLVFLGEASFSFYMVHQLVIRYISIAAISPVAIVMLSLVFSLLLSGLLYTLFEEPMRIRVKNFLEVKLVGRVQPLSVRGFMRWVRATQK